MLLLPHLVLQNNNIDGTITIGNNPQDVDLREADLHNVAVSFRRQLQRNNKAGPVILHYTDQGRTLDCRSTSFQPRKTRTAFLMIQCSKFQTLTSTDDPKLENRPAVSTETRKMASHAIQKETTQQVQYIETFTGRFYYFTGTNSFYLDCSSDIRPNEKQQALSCKEISMVADLLDFNERTT